MPIQPVRFDDLTPGQEQSFELVDPIDEVVASTLTEVPDAITRVEEATADGAWAGGFIAYEAAPAFDPALAVVQEPRGALPLVWFGLYRDRRPVPSPPSDSDSDSDSDKEHTTEWHPDITLREYEDAIATIRSAIERGDTYQTNYTFRLEAPLDDDVEALYRHLLLAQRGGFGALVRTGTHSILSASPEQFFHVRDGSIRLCPMKGTMPRGRWSAEDLDRRDRLAASTKDRAENLMIVDLLRNDVGRIAEFGSVEVTELFTVEQYATLWQLTSTITAQVPPDIGLGQLLAALFPSGSVTGAPKASTMQLIAELERSPRGVYCGAIGYVAPGAPIDAQFNVAIRTVVVDEHAGTARYGTGGGITWDSSSSVEYEEALTKAAVLEVDAKEFSLIETMRWDDGEFLMLDEHLARLHASAEYWGFRHDMASIQQALSSFGADAAARVRLTLARYGAISIEASGLHDPFVWSPTDMTGPSVPTGVATVPVDSNDPLLFHKTTHRARYETARAERADADEMLLVNERGEVTEATISNVAARFGNAWITPPLDAGCLPGVFRHLLLERGVLIERTLPLDELTRADEIALINSVRGWRRAVVVASAPLGSA